MLTEYKPNILTYH